jgi:heat shock protein HslJ
VKFQGGDGKTLTPTEKNRYTVAFNADGKVTVRVDCNRGRGTWSSSGPNQLTFGPLALTRAMCPPAPLNDRMARDWQHVRSYIIKDGHLFLSLMADGGIYEFEPLEAVATAGIPNELPASFIGTMPCADCPGIRYQVNLLPDHTFVSRMTYLERKSQFDDYGSWQFAGDGTTLVLQGQRGARQQFSLRDATTLRNLDANGHEINSAFSYDLKRSPSFAPIQSGVKDRTGIALEGTEWKLIGLGDTPVHSASQQQEPYMLLTPESHRVSGSSGCNRMVGSYELSGDHLTFREMAGTMMACASGMDTEKALQDALAEARNWKISGQALDLFDANGRLLARFEAR